MAPGNPSPAPTGCFKCGRPGHWSRDCPSSPASSSAPNAFVPGRSPLNPSTAASNGNVGTGTPAKPSKTSGSTVAWKRPKLTPDLLLSKDGLGYVLENFPRMVKIQGRGHEVEDLRSLLDAYVHWHSLILPYFSFDQFVEKVEKVGTTKRVRVCVRELKEKVVQGEMPKLAQDEQRPEFSQSEVDIPSRQNLPMEGGDQGTPEDPHDDALSVDIHEDLFHEFYEQAIDEVPSTSVPPPQRIGSVQSRERVTNSLTCVNEDQKLRMEANRLKALERAKARGIMLV